MATKTKLPKTKVPKTSLSFKAELKKQRSKASAVHEPILNPLNYRETLNNAIQWYNQTCEPKDFRRYFVDHFGKRINFAIGDVADLEFRPGGLLSRMLANGNCLEEQHLVKLENELDRIRAIIVSRDPQPVKTTSAVPTGRPNIQTRMDEKVGTFMSEFNGLVDDFVTDGKIPNTAGLLKSVGIAGPMTKKVAAQITKNIAELEEAVAGTDKQLVEGYSNFKKPELKKLLGIYTNLMDSLVQAKVAVVRKIRTKKVKPAGQLVAKVKYMKEFPALGIQSVAPATIIGCSELWVYNTKYKQLATYYAMDDSGITVKGTTLQGWNTEKSGKRALRKPETIAALVGQGKRAMVAFLKSLTTKDSSPNGRINEECIILATFK